MAAPDSTLIDQQNDADIPTPATPTAPRANAEKFRGVHRRITDWVKKTIVNAMPWRRIADGLGSVEESDAVFRTGITIIGASQSDGTGAKLQSPSASISTLLTANINGGRPNYPICIVTETGKAAVRYFKIAQFRANDDAGSADLLGLTATVGGWGSNPRAIIHLSCGNRGGFGCQATVMGEPYGCGFAAYQLADKTAVLYLRLPNGYVIGDVTVTLNYQAILFPQWYEEVPPADATLVYDSTGSTTPPLLQVDQNMMALRGMIRTGSANVGFQVTNVKTAANLSVNTGQYLELKLDTGATLKVALLN